MEKDIIATRCEELIEVHGGVRAAARALNCDPNMLSRLRKGGIHPTDESLAVLGIRRLYVSDPHPHLAGIAAATTRKRRIGTVPSH